MTSIIIGKYKIDSFDWTEASYWVRKISLNETSTPVGGISVHFSVSTQAWHVSFFGSKCPFQDEYKIIFKDKIMPFKNLTDAFYHVNNFVYSIEKLKAFL